MLTTQWYKVINDVWGNKTRTFLIVLSIAVGLFAVGTTFSSRRILSVELARNYAAVNPSSGVVRTLELFDEDFIHSVQRMPQVADADARRNFMVRVRIEDDLWRDMSIFSVKDYKDIHVNKLRSVSGAYPPGKHEILVERSGKDFLKVDIGDTLVMETADQKRCELRVAGFVHDLVQLPTPFDGNPYGYVSFYTLACFGEPQGYNELAVVAKDANNKTQAQNVITKVKDKAEKSGLTIPMSMTAEPGQLPLDDVLQTILLVLSGLGMLSLFLSAFLIVNTFSSLITQQMRQIGIMKAVGASTAQVMTMYLGMVLCYALMALAIAIPLGIFGADWLSQFMATLFNFDLGQYEIPSQAIAIQVGVGLIVPLLSALYPLLTNLRVTAAEAMSAFNISKTRWGWNWIDRLISGSNLWFSRFVLMRPAILSLRNTFRSKGRLALTLATLTLAGAVFTNVFSVNDSLTRTVDDMMKLFGFDVWVSFAKPYRVQALEQEALLVDGATKADVWLALASRRVRQDNTETGLIYIFAPNPESEIILSPAIVSGRWLTPEDEHAIVVNSNLTRDEKDIQLGDDIIMKINGQNQKLRVVGISLGMGMPMAYISYEYAARITGNSGRASAVMVLGERHDSEGVARFSSALESHFRKAGYQITSVVTMTTEKEEAQASFSILTSLLLIMALLLALVGGFSLMGTMSINVIERTREIGVLRAIGAPDSGVSKVFILEGLCIGGLSWVLGCLLSFLFGKFTSDLVGNSMLGLPLTYTFSLLGVWLWLALVMALSAAASFIPARNATRLTVREVLAYE